MKQYICVVIMIGLYSVYCAVIPDCSDPKTYKMYKYNTGNKSVLDNANWDRTNNKPCNLSDKDTDADQFCGDCDFDNIVADVWYRFEGLYTQMAVYPDNTTCPDQGYCNGYMPFSLIQDPTDKTQYQYFLSNFNHKGSGDCESFALDKAKVSTHDCHDFFLYKFSNVHLKSFCKDVKQSGTTYYYPISFCFNATICGAGYGVTSDRCAICKENTYSPTGENTCLSCPQNMASKSGSISADNCACVGGFGQQKGSIDCTKCPKNMFSPNINNTCSSCPTNMISKSGSQTIDDCICKAGYYGKNMCKACPNNMFSESGDINCTKCPNNSMSGIGSATCNCIGGFGKQNTSRNCTICPKNTYSLPGDNSCISCDSRKSKEGSTSPDDCKPNSTTIIVISSIAGGIFVVIVIIGVVCYKRLIP